MKQVQSGLNAETGTLTWPPSFPMPRDFLLTGPREIPIHSIIAEVCAKHRITWGQLVSNRRSPTYSWPRQEVYWRAHKETALSYPEIGAALGRDHTTVIYGVKAHERRVAGGTT